MDNHIRPAIEMANDDEQRALRYAIIFALQQGIATDDFDTVPSNRSLVSIAHKLGIEWEDSSQSEWEQ